MWCRKRWHPKRQGKAERNGPEGHSPECTSGLAARRTQLCQGEQSERPAWSGRGTAPAHPDIPRLAVKRGSGTIRAGRRRYREPVTQSLRHPCSCRLHEVISRPPGGPLRHREGHPGSHAPVTRCRVRIGAQTGFDVSCLLARTTVPPTSAAMAVPWFEHQFASVEELT
jgi:hypothetical protein